MKFSRMFHRKKWGAAGKVLLAMLLGASLLVSGCGGGKPGTTSSGGKKQVLTIGSTNNPKTVNPESQSDSAGLFINRMMYDSLLGQPEFHKFTNHLAVSFETKDKKVYTVRLNPKAKWSDGKPLTADDVVFSFNLAANPKVESGWNRYLKSLAGVGSNGKLAAGVAAISGVVKKDAATIELTCKQAMDPDFIKDQIGFNIPILPKHIYSKIDPEKIPSSPEGVKPTVFSGPFKLVKFVSNDHVELAANENYVLGKPKLSKIFVKIQNGTNMVVDLKAGKTHMSAGNIIGKIPVQDIDVLKQEKNLSVKNVPSLGCQVMEINNTLPEFNKDFRMALAHAINRQQIVDQLYKGYASLVPTIYTKASPVYDASVKNFPYDVELAKKELAASGYDTSKELTLLVPLGNVQREQSADLIQQNLQAIGLKVKLQKMDFPTLMSRAQKKDYQILLMGLSMQADPDYLRFYDPSSLINFSHVDDKKLTGMMEKAAIETDGKKRTEEYHEIQKYLAANMFHIPLYGEMDFIIQVRNLDGGLKPYWHGSFDDLYKWSFK